MTRSGAPFQGENGDGTNERNYCDSGKPAGTAHIEDPLRNPETPSGPALRTDAENSRVGTGQSAELSAVPPRERRLVSQPKARFSGFPPALLALVDVPEDRRRRTVEHTGDRLPPGARNRELSERHVD